MFASCSRAESCNFCRLLTFYSETFPEKHSPLNALSNYGDRWGKLRRVRKHKSHPAASLRWLARKIRSRQCKRLWNWFGKSKCPGARLDLTENFHHEHFIDPTNCPWVSEDDHVHETLRKFSHGNICFYICGSCWKRFFYCLRLPANTFFTCKQFISVFTTSANNLFQNFSTPPPHPVQKIMVRA